MKDRKLSIDFNLKRIKKKIPINSEILISNTRYNDKYYLQEVKLEQFVESYDKILVIARAIDKTTKYNFENQVVQDLAVKGVVATTTKLTQRLCRSRPLQKHF